MRPSISSIALAKQPGGAPSKTKHRKTKSELPSPLREPLMFAKQCQNLSCSPNIASVEIKGLAVHSNKSPSCRRLSSSLSPQGKLMSELQSPSLSPPGPRVSACSNPTWHISERVLRKGPGLCVSTGRLPGIDLSDSVLLSFREVLACFERFPFFFLHF